MCPFCTQAGCKWYWSKEEEGGKDGEFCKLSEGGWYFLVGCGDLVDLVYLSVPWFLHSYYI